MHRQHVLIIGDALTDATTRYEFLNTMLRRRYEVTVIDLAADGADAVTFDALVETVGEHLNREHGSEVLPAVIGVGSGATVALQVAAEHPDSLSSLTVVGGWLVAPAKMHAIIRLFEQLTTLDPVAAAEFLHTQMTSSLGWATAAHPAPQAVLSVLRATSTVDLTDTASAISTPTLIIGCARDEFASLEQSQQLFGAIANARFTTITSGHNVLAERPAELLSLIDQFIAQPEHYPAGAAIAEARP